MAPPSPREFPKRRRILLAKVGLDGHDRGIKVIARALREAGFEILYLGLHNAPTEIVASAIQEDVDAIGLSIHSAAHMILFKEMIKLLEAEQAGDIPLFGGGIIPDEDVKDLKALGVRKIFNPGTSMDEIVSFVTEMVK